MFLLHVWLFTSSQRLCTYVYVVLYIKKKYTTLLWNYCLNCSEWVWFEEKYPDISRRWLMHWWQVTASSWLWQIMKTTPIVSFSQSMGLKLSHQNETSSILITNTTTSLELSIIVCHERPAHHQVLISDPLYTIYVFWKPVQSLICFLSSLGVLCMCVSVCYTPASF